MANKNFGGMFCQPEALSTVETCFNNYYSSVTVIVINKNFGEMFCQPEALGTVETCLNYSSVCWALKIVFLRKTIQNLSKGPFNDFHLYTGCGHNQTKLLRKSTLWF